VTTIPDAAVAVIAAALDDYRLTTPTNSQNPHGAAERAVEYLAFSGWTIRIEPQPRTTCPTCTAHPLITTTGRIRRHGPHTNPCPSSGQPATDQYPA
jgi:hypothetical protein